MQRSVSPQKKKKLKNKATPLLVYYIYYIDKIKWSSNANIKIRENAKRYSGILHFKDIFRK